MTKNEIEKIIRQAVKEAREETKKEICKQVQIITDIDPSSIEGKQQLREIFNWARSGQENCEKTWSVAKEIFIKTLIVGFMTVIGYGVAVAIKKISGS